ncbi:hypothetical protein [Treponema putidum]|uniref:hypothetical protein n=1 Tax=Treponema putidum TaxID=221027 RepID=UPI003D8E5498
MKNSMLEKELEKFNELHKKRYWPFQCSECGCKGISKDLILEETSYDYYNCSEYSVYCPKCLAEICNDDYSNCYSRSKGISIYLKWFFRFITFYRFRERQKYTL